MSVARILTLRRLKSRRLSANKIASEYGSSPDEQPALQANGTLGFRKSRDHLCPKEIEVLRFAEEARLVGRQGIDHCDQFFARRITLHQIEVLVEAAESECPQSLREPGLYEPLLAGLELDAAKLIDEFANSFKLRFGQL